MSCLPFDCEKHALLIEAIEMGPAPLQFECQTVSGYPPGGLVRSIFYYQEHAIVGIASYEDTVSSLKPR